MSVGLLDDPNYQSSGPGWLQQIGAFANRARQAINPWSVVSPTDVASFGPGGGLTQAATENFPAARRALQAGDWGTAAREGAAGLLGAGGDMLWAGAPIAGVGAKAWNSSDAAQTSVPARKG